MADTNTILEGSLKYRDGKKWKSRWCVIKKLSPVADRLHISLYKDGHEKYRSGQEKAMFPLEEFFGIESDLTVDKEQHVLAIICQTQVILLAFRNKETMLQWKSRIRANLGQEEQFPVKLVKVPTGSKTPTGVQLRLHIQGQRICLTGGCPPKQHCSWNLNELRRFGMVSGKLVFEGGSRCGKGAGVYAFLTDFGEQVTHMLQNTSQGDVQGMRQRLDRRSRLSLPSVWGAAYDQLPSFPRPGPQTDFQDTQTCADLNFRSHDQHYKDSSNEHSEHEQRNAGYDDDTDSSYSEFDSIARRHNPFARSGSNSGSYKRASRPITRSVSAGTFPRRYKDEQPFLAMHTYQPSNGTQETEPTHDRKCSANPFVDDFPYGSQSKSNLTKSEVNLLDEVLEACNMRTNSEVEDPVFATVQLGDTPESRKCRSRLQSLSSTGSQHTLYSLLEQSSSHSGSSASLKDITGIVCSTGSSTPPEPFANTKDSFDKPLQYVNLDRFEGESEYFTMSGNMHRYVNVPNSRVPTATVNPARISHRYVNIPGSVDHPQQGHVCGYVNIPGVEQPNQTIPSLHSTNPFASALGNSEPCPYIEMKGGGRSLESSSSCINFDNLQETSFSNLRSNSLSRIGSRQSGAKMQLIQEERPEDNYVRMKGRTDTRGTSGLQIDLDSKPPCVSDSEYMMMNLGGHQHSRNDLRLLNLPSNCDTPNTMRLSPIQGGNTPDKPPFNVEGEDAYILMNVGDCKRTNTIEPVCHQQDFNPAWMSKFSRSQSVKNPSKGHSKPKLLHSKSLEDTLDNDNYMVMEMPPKHSRQHSCPSDTATYMEMDPAKGKENHDGEDKENVQRPFEDLFRFDVYTSSLRKKVKIPPKSDVPSNVSNDAIDKTSSANTKVLTSATTDEPERTSSFGNKLNFFSKFRRRSSSRGERTSATSANSESSDAQSDSEGTLRKSRSLHKVRSTPTCSQENILDEPSNSSDPLIQKSNQYLKPEAGRNKKDNKRSLSMETPIPKTKANDEPSSSVFQESSSSSSQSSGSSQSMKSSDFSVSSVLSSNKPLAVVSPFNSSTSLSSDASSQATQTSSLPSSEYLEMKPSHMTVSVSSHQLHPSDSTSVLSEKGDKIPSDVAAAQKVKRLSVTCTAGSVHSLPTHLHNTVSVMCEVSTVTKPTSLSCGQIPRSNDPFLPPRPVKPEKPEPITLKPPPPPRPKGKKPVKLVLGIPPVDGEDKWKYVQSAEKSPVKTPSSKIPGIPENGDYETASLCSNSSWETTRSSEGPKSSPAATTLRPRFGKEYQTLDRKKLLEEDTASSAKSTSSACVFTFDISTNAESPTRMSIVSGISRSGEESPPSHYLVRYHSYSPNAKSDSSQAVYMNIESPPKAVYMNIDLSPPESPHSNLNREQTNPLLNYAEIDLSHQSNAKVSARKSPQRACNIEYATIDMVATAAAQRVGKEHAQLREDTLKRKDMRATTPQRQLSKESRSMVSTQQRVDRKMSTASSSSINSQ